MNMCSIRKESMYKKYDNILNLFGFQQVNFIPTRITPTTKSALDHIIYNNDNKISQYGVVTAGLRGVEWVHSLFLF